MFLTQLGSWRKPGISIYLNFLRKAKALIKVSQFAEKPAMGFFSCGVWFSVCTLHQERVKDIFYTGLASAFIKTENVPLLMHLSA